CRAPPMILDVNGEPFKAPRPTIKRRYGGWLRAHRERPQPQPTARYHHEPIPAAWYAAQSAAPNEPATCRRISADQQQELDALRREYLANQAWLKTRF
ncbi:MAG: hypothetical protein WBG92_12070, partial [Thiohalocapsa sp.]